jgi:tRNA dimethylallyltransferase
LLYGLAPAPPKNDEIRAQHQAFVTRRSRAALHDKLLAVDPESHQRLMPNDFVRVSRALEVYELTGRPLSEYQREHGFRQPRYRARMFGVRHEREALHARIEARVRHMLKVGWVDEVHDLVVRGYGQSRPMSSVGYAQVKAAIDLGEPIDEEQLVRAVAQVTRVFSRRQRTWLREQPVDWLDPEMLGRADVNSTLSAVLARGVTLTQGGER